MLSPFMVGYYTAMLGTVVIVGLVLLGLFRLMKKGLKLVKGKEVNPDE